MCVGATRVGEPCGSITDNIVRQSISLQTLYSRLVSGQLGGVGPL